VVVCACFGALGFFEAEDDFDGFFVFDDLGMSDYVLALLIVTM